MRHLVALLAILLAAQPCPAVWEAVPEGRLELVNSRYVAGWACVPATGAEVELKLSIDGGARELTSPERVVRDSLYPHITANLCRCGYAFALPGGLVPGEHRLEVLGRIAPGDRWTSLGTAVTPTNGPCGRLAVTSTHSHPENDDDLIAYLRLWAFDPDVDEYQPWEEGQPAANQTIHVEVCYRGKRVYQYLIPNFCQLAHEGPEWHAGQVTLDEGRNTQGFLEYYAYDHPDGERVFLGAVLLKPHH